MKIVRKTAIFILIPMVIFGFFYIQSPSKLDIEYLVHGNPSDLLMETQYYSSDRRIFGYENVTENNFLRLYLNPNTTQFAVLDKRNNHVWYSSLFTSDTTATLSTRNLQKSTLALTYLETDNTTKTINNYEFSISPETFDIEYVENGFILNYSISDSKPKGYWFPTEISLERFEEKVINPFYDYEFTEEDEFTRSEMLRVLNNYYRAKEDDPSVYRLTIIRQDQTASNIGNIEVEELFYLMYVIGTYGNDVDENGQILETYNFEDVNVDNEAFGIEKTQTNPEFFVPLEVQLKQDSLEIFVDHEKIIENEPYEIISMTVLPYFGAQPKSEDGYMIIPEGSGAIIRLNNDRTQLRSYESIVYGNDMTTLNPTLTISDVGSKMPIFGLKIEENSFLAINEEGHHKMKVRAEISGKNDRFNKVNSEYLFRDEGLYFLTDNGVRIWNEERDLFSITTKYYFFSETEANYSSMARLYGSYLSSKYQIEANLEDRRGLALDIIGSYDVEDYFLFFPYKDIQVLTSFEQTQMILDTLVDSGIDIIHASYIGWFNNGINHEIASRIIPDRELGNIHTFIEYDQDNPNVRVHYDVNYMVAYERPFLYSNNHFSRIVGGTINEQFPFDISTRLRDKSKDPMYYLKYQTIQSNIEDSKVDLTKLNIESISLREMGNNLYSDFHRGFFVTRNQALEFQEGMIMQLNKEYNMMLNFPNTYAVAFSNYIKNVSYIGSNQRLADQSIPFYQMAIAPYVSYSIPSLNMNQSEIDMYYLFKAIETGAQLKYTLTFEDTSHLSQTRYNIYLSTQFEKNKHKIEALYQTYINILGDSNSYIISHEINNENIVVVTYSDDRKIELNYNDFSYRLIV